MATTATRAERRAGDYDLLARMFERDLRVRGLSDNTRSIYMTGVQRLGDFLAERNMPLVVADVTTEHLREFLLMIRDSGGSAGTVEVRHKALNQFFKFLEAEGEIGSNPMKRIKQPKVVLQPPAILPDDAMRKLLAACAGQDFDERRDTAILRLFIDTGMRRTELALLKLEDVDMDNDVITVLGKGGRYRTIPFGHKAGLALGRYLRSRGGHWAARLDAFWLGKKGALSSGGVALMLTRRARQAGLSKVHAHRFRHAFAHGWLAAGGQEGDLMALAGWSSRAMLNRYGASAQAERARVAHRRLGLGDRL